MFISKLEYNVFNVERMSVDISLVFSYEFLFCACSFPLSCNLEGEI